MKRVLIALDYGLSAQKIAEQGFELAKSMNAKVTLLHVVADESYYNAIDSAAFIGFYSYDYFDTVDSDSLINSSLNFLENIKTHLKDSTIETIAKQGDFATVILDTAENQNSSIIVMGTHSHNWLEKAIMGSVTESVLENTLIPMYIIPIKELK